MDVLSEKDHTDCVCRVLEEHLEYGKIYAKEYRDLVWDVNGTACGEKNCKTEKSVAYTGVSGAENGYNLYINYVLNPRVEDELLRPYRKGILSFLQKSRKPLSAQIRQKSGIISRCTSLPTRITSARP